MRIVQIPQKLTKNFVPEKILRTRNCRRSFIKNKKEEKKPVKNKQTKSIKYKHLSIKIHSAINIPNAKNRISVYFAATDSRFLLSFWDFEYF